MPEQTNVERGQAARTKLLDTAEVLIGEIGWNAVSTRILADRAGVRSGLVHYHFESLQALLRQAAIEAVRRLLADTTGFLAASPDPAAWIEAMLTELDRFTGDDPASLLFIEAYLAATRDPVLHGQMRDLVNEFRTAIATALERAGHPAPDAAAVLIMAVFDGFLLHKGLNRDLSAAQIAPLLRQVTDTRPNGAQQ
jgi:AcrR family transcriptional regulator